MTYYDLSAKEVASVVQADTRNGLTQAEAQRRLTAFGENKLDEKKKKPLIVRFLEQFKDAMIIILLIAAVISFGVACYQVFGMMYLPWQGYLAGVGLSLVPIVVMEIVKAFGQPF